MRKVTFQIGERVSIIEANKITYGVIRKVFPEVVPPVFMIETEDGEIVKTEIDKVAKTPVDKSEIDNNKNEKIQDDGKANRNHTEKAEITITPAEFHDITTKIVTSECAEMEPAGLMVGMTMAVVMAKIHHELFKDEAEE